MVASTFLCPLSNLYMAQVTTAITTTPTTLAEPNLEERDNKHEKQAPTTKVFNDSSTATVMGMAMGYGIETYQIFVGSLRRTGYTGNIILAVSSDIKANSEHYLKSQNVILHKTTIVECHENITAKFNPRESSKHAQEAITCIAPYDTIKVRWGRYPVLRDQLIACKTCTGPVLITDVRDTLFQRDPFASGYELGHTLDDTTTLKEGSIQVFQEHKSISTQHWLVKFKLRTCKNELQYHEPMLCSGTTIAATKQAMIFYLNQMHDEMKVWLADGKCHFAGNGDDQAIHNYLYYAGKLAPYAVAIPNRMGMVHTVGAQGAMILAAQQQYLKTMGPAATTPNTPEANAAPMRRHQQWLDPVYDLTDDGGYFTNYDGQRSPVVHQYDRFGAIFSHFWVRDHSNLTDLKLK